MKILFDHQAFTFQRFGGVSKCFCELISNMSSDIDTEIAVKESDNVHLIESALCHDIKQPKMNRRKWKGLFPFKGSGVAFRTLAKIGLLTASEEVNQKYSIEKIKKGDFDVFHPTFFDPYFLKYIGDKPWVITVHDMMPELFPEYFNQRNEQIVFKKKYLGKAAAIVAVSEQTKADLVRLLGISKERITVVYHGGPKKEYVGEPSMIDAPYFFYVGTREAYKNFPQTLVDFADFHQMHPEVKLVCTGGCFTLVERKMIEKLNIVDAVIHIRANGHDMKVLYAHAVAFIYPSLYEGFGMPILEAFAYGCPVLLNNKSCFPEIAADAGIYFESEPGKSNLVRIMEYIYSLSEVERKEIVEKGYLRLGDFSWEKSAEKLANLYSKVYRERLGGGNERPLIVSLLRRRSLAKCA